MDPFETVLTMRRQRMKMVQKAGQYNYMFRCLAQYVTNGGITEIIFNKFLLTKQKFSIKMYFYLRAKKAFLFRANN